MNEENLPKSRIFVCVAEKEPGKAACLKGEGEKCAVWMKSEVDKRNLKPNLRITRTKCLGYCDPSGTSVITFPENRQVSGITFTEVQGLFEEFVKTSI